GVREGVEDEAPGGRVVEQAAVMDGPARADVLHRDVRRAGQRDRVGGLDELVGAAVDAGGGDRPGRLVAGVQRGQEVRAGGHLPDRGPAVAARNAQVRGGDAVVRAGEQD